MSVCICVCICYICVCVYVCVYTHIFPLHPPAHFRQGSRLSLRATSRLKQGQRAAGKGKENSVILYSWGKALIQSQNGRAGRGHQYNL